MKATLFVFGVLAALILVGGLMFSGVITNPFSNVVPATAVDSTDSTQTEVAKMPVAVTSSTVSPFSTSAVVSGTVTPNGAFTNYWYEYGPSVNLGSQTPHQTIGSGFTPIAAPAYISGLSKDTTYYFRLVAQNDLGTTPGAQNTFHTATDAVAPVGSVPSIETLAATNVVRTSANINGSVIPNKSPTQFWFEYGETTNLGSVSTLQSVGDGAAAVPASLALSTLAPATTYYFRLNAQNQFGTINGKIMTFTTEGPVASALPVVTTLPASPVATTTATLRGTVHPKGAQTNYWFEYSTNSLFISGTVKSTSQRSVGAGATTVSVDSSVADLKTKTTYYYRTVAQNSGGITRGANESFKTN